MFDSLEELLKALDEGVKICHKNCYWAGGMYFHKVEGKIVSHNGCEVTIDDINDSYHQYCAYRGK